MGQSISKYLILGHGIEEIKNIEERKIIPEGITLITLSECGIITSTDEVCPMVNAFADRRMDNVLSFPIVNKEDVEMLIGGKKIHIYTTGAPYPTLKLQMFLDWRVTIPDGSGEEIDAVKIMKSGVYKFPLNATDFELNPAGETICDKSFKYLKPYGNPWQKTDMPSDFTPLDMFGGSLFPTVADVTHHMETVKKEEGLKKVLEFPLEDVFQKCGKGIYYYVVCRAPEDVLSPIRLFEVLNETPENKVPFEPFFNDDWISKIPELLPILDTYIATIDQSHYAWGAKTAKKARNQYAKLLKVPLIRQKSQKLQNGNDRRKTKKKGALGIMNI
jgi:hypothetical protein